MNTKISQDFERLSAYIDNQLSAAEKAELEARLAQEADLQAALADLRRTVRALRSLPTVKPPRNFTLSPEQAGVRVRRGPLFPVFRLAAALCTVLLVLAVARDYAASSLATSAVGDVTTQGGATSLTAPNAAPLLTPSPEGSLEAYGVSALAPTEVVSQDAAVTPLAHFAQVAPTATPEAGGGQVPGPATPEATNKSAAATETPADQAVSAAAAAPSATETVNAVRTAVQAPIPAPQPDPWRVVEVVLAGLALALAAAAWFTRRA
jgi:anti-sigma factor RsiW